MSRLARVDTPDHLNHVRIRGIERQKIFNDDRDRKNFIEQLSILPPETKTQCCPCSFLSNHDHFLLSRGPSKIACLMKSLLNGYAVSYIRQQKRRGQLFQHRYESIICLENAYLQKLVWHIHYKKIRN